jgi:uncharacterized protein (DUF486 family)
MAPELLSERSIVMRTVLLLTISNIFMTFAWYGHLKYKATPLWIAILVSWGIAFFEYCFQVPANRIGHGQFTATQLKIMQEVITLVVFCGFVVLYLHEPLRWNYFVGFAFLVGAVFFVFGFPEKKPAASEVRSMNTTESAEDAEEIGRS